MLQVAHESGKAEADNLRNELLTNVHKFSSQVSNAIQQLCGDIHLKIPNLQVPSVSRISCHSEQMRSYRTSVK